MLVAEDLRYTNGYTKVCGWILEVVRVLDMKKLRSLQSQWVRGLMVANVGFEFSDRSSIPIVCQIMDDDLKQVVYIVP